MNRMFSIMSYVRGQVSDILTIFPQYKGAVSQVESGRLSSGKVPDIEGIAADFQWDCCRLSVVGL